jgi:hypothetical protein
LEENLAAGSLKLTDEELKEVRKIAVEADSIPGDRYMPSMLKSIFGDTPENVRQSSAM